VHQRYVIVELRDAPTQCRSGLDRGPLARPVVADPHLALHDHLVDPLEDLVEVDRASSSSAIVDPSSIASSHCSVGL
jgi:hypothetical protein